MAHDNQSGHAPLWRSLMADVSELMMAEAARGRTAELDKQARVLADRMGMLCMATGVNKPMIMAQAHVSLQAMVCIVLGSGREIQSS